MKQFKIYKEAQETRKEYVCVYVHIYIPMCMYTHTLGWCQQLNPELCVWLASVMSLSYILKPRSELLKDA